MNLKWFKPQKSEESGGCCAAEAALGQAARVHSTNGASRLGCGVCRCSTDNRAVMVSGPVHTASRGDSICPDGKDNGGIENLG